MKIDPEHIGYLALLVSLTVYIPLLWDVYKNYCVIDLYYWWIGLQILALGMWLWYGYLGNSKPTIISTILNIAILIFIGLSKWHLESSGLAKKC